MTTKRQPKVDTTFEGVRVRVYATRSEYECLIGEGEIDDPEAHVMIYPKVGGPEAWAHQAFIERDHG